VQFLTAMHVSLQFKFVLQVSTGTGSCTTFTTRCSVPFSSMDVIMLPADAVHDTSLPHTELFAYCKP